ncbi:FGGY family carbohydrate kinase [Streptomyces sp. NPDC001835]|uniref:FGGY family carbohydrate kinase n=1 Tax=Streptomyces sp. NPDC001835 TaxID=3154528 RepID=UPI003333BEAA
MTAILAIDQGTSGTKVIVLDAEDGTVVVAEEAVRPTYPDGGGVEQNLHELLDSVLTAGRREVGLASRPIDAVALANQGETVLAWDPATETPLTPAIVLQDRRAKSICGVLAEHGEALAQRTGLVLDPYFSAPKRAWLRRNLTREGVVTTSDTWFMHHLAGEFVTDASTTSRSLILDLDSYASSLTSLQRHEARRRCPMRARRGRKVVYTTWPHPVCHMGSPGCRRRGSASCHPLVTWCFTSLRRPTTIAATFRANTVRASLTRGK